MEDFIVLECLLFSIVISMLMKKAIDFDINQNMQ